MKQLGEGRSRASLAAEHGLHYRTVTVIGASMPVRSKGEKRGRRQLPEPSPVTKLRINIIRLNPDKSHKMLGRMLSVSRQYIATIKEYMERYDAIESEMRAAVGRPPTPE